jgi:pimeloyl-ACP methyl ester carboxylesterase
MMVRHGIAFLLGIGLMLAVPSAWSGTVESEVGPGLSASALYSPGDDDAPVVLILHGFLQTHNFYTVRRLHDSLADEGYTVLSPTLSLGIHKRVQSLDCEALHLHDLDGDVAELAHWVAWLQRRHGKPVVLIGHSAGGHVMTRYLHEHGDAPVAMGILVSLSHLRGSEKGQVQGDVGEYSLSYCEKYMTPPAAYRSYVDWGREQMLAAIQAHSGAIAVILGSDDDRIEASWRQVLTDGGVNVLNIDGANHFFDSAHEFDLLEAVEALLDDQLVEG